MKVIKIILSFTAMTMAATLILTTTRNSNISQHHDPSKLDNSLEREPVSTDKMSRFLEHKGRLPNPRAAAVHCKKDHEKCHHIISGNGRNTTCCNNKCIDLWYDKNNCGACKKKCDFTDECCRGECVNLTFDKRHCGFCHNRCKMTPGYCIFGICDYA